MQARHKTIKASAIDFSSVPYLLGTTSETSEPMLIGEIEGQGLVYRKQIMGIVTGYQQTFPCLLPEAAVVLKIDGRLMIDQSNWRDYVPFGFYNSNNGTVTHVSAFYRNTAGLMYRGSYNSGSIRAWVEYLIPQL